MPDRRHADGPAGRPQRAGEAGQAEDEPRAEGGRREDGQGARRRPLRRMQRPDPVQAEGCV